MQNGGAPERWWVSPFRLHDELSDAQRSRVLPSCYVAAAGGAFAFLGCVVGAIGVLGSWIHG